MFPIADGEMNDPTELSNEVKSNTTGSPEGQSNAKLSLKAAEQGDQSKPRCFIGVEKHRWLIEIL